VARARKKRSLVYVISIGAHLVVGAALAFIPQQKLREVVGIAFADAPKPKPAAPKPESHPAKASPARAARAAAPVAAAPAAEQAATHDNNPSSFANLGISLDSTSTDGVAVPIAAKIEAPKFLAAVAPRAPKLLVAQREVCNEEPKKAVPERIVRPEYTNEARMAEIEGRVRLELSIDENGIVRDAKVLSGLGHGLDEQAIAAAKKMQFKPASKCGNPVMSTFVLAMRFALSS
jgi:periplasmic protein TonB